jgi:hypothetical protein
MQGNTAHDGLMGRVPDETLLIVGVVHTDDDWLRVHPRVSHEAPYGMPCPGWPSRTRDDTGVSSPYG